MKAKKIIALFLCIAMIMCTLASCDLSVDDVLGKYTDTGDEQTAGVRDYEAGRAAYEADEVVMTIDGEEVTWDEYFDWICFGLVNYENSLGSIEDFTTATATGTISDTILEEADYMIKMYRAVEKKASELGVEYPADIESLIEDDWNSGIEYYGDEESLMEFINQYYGSKENYEYIYKLDSISPNLFEHFYGKDGADLTQEQLDAGSEGYVMAKHILIKSTDEETGLVLEEADLKAARDTIESIYAKLEAYEGDDLEGYFDELIKKYTDDEGSLIYPDGYLFQEGDMVTEFYDAALSVEEGNYSEIIESSYGYHIVMRIPINYDSVPMTLASYGYNVSLRYVIANELFAKESESWINNVTVKTTAFHENIDLAQVFPAA